VPYAPLSGSPWDASPLLSPNESARPPLAQRFSKLLPYSLA
jgi:hypothetical protein